VKENKKEGVTYRNFVAIDGITRNQLKLTLKEFSVKVSSVVGVDGVNVGQTKIGCESVISSGLG
jgi:hypothetical protein